MGQETNKDSVDFYVAPTTRPNEKLMNETVEDALMPTKAPTLAWRGAIASSGAVATIPQVSTK